jgi:hypothetical protein
VKDVKFSFCALLLIIFFFFSSGSLLSAGGESTFVFAMQKPSNKNDEFFAVTSDKEVIKLIRKQLSLPIKDRNMMINGAIARGNGGNKNWSWHFVPNKWNLAEVSMELCDGTPEQVENNILEWVENKKRFCPWHSYVLEEMRN